MSTFNTRKLLAGIALLGLMLGGTAAHAAGTAAGTSITNTATLVTTGETVTSNQTDFTVDNKVKVTVSESNNTATLVTTPATDVVVTFTVTNDGNFTQDYQLTAANVANGTASAVFSTNDTFDATSCSAFADGNANGTYESGFDTATFLNAVAPDVTQTVFVVCDIPSSLANNSFAAISLMATTSDSTTAGLDAITVETSGANTSGIDVVFADTTGSESVDTARDGKHSARDAYVVSTATVTVSKSVSLVCDPFNYNTNPKFIPGAYVQYELTLTNTGGAEATLTSITDVLNSNTALDPDLRVGASNACESSAPLSAIGNSVRVVCSDTVNDCQFTTGTSGGAGIRFFTGASDSDGVTYTGTTGGTLAATFATMGDASLGASDTMTIRFNAIIQ